MSVKIQPLLTKQTQLFITDTCNLRCEGCPYPNQSKEEKLAIRKKEISPLLWRKITNYLYSYGIRLFCVIGGEPASYSGLDEVIDNITVHSDSFVLLSTSGIHLLHNSSLRKSVGKSLSKHKDLPFKNGIVISFDSIPSSKSLTIKDSREFKAKQGLDFVRKMKSEFFDKITYQANVMVTPNNLDLIPKIQEYLENEGIYTNLCTHQYKCFGKKSALFSIKDKFALTKIGAEMIRRKIYGKLITNSVSYLSQFPAVVGMENYKCWEEKKGNSVIDVGSEGNFRYCNWIGQNLKNGPPGIASEKLMNGKISWAEFWNLSKRATKRLCSGCSWSRRDRGLEPMVNFNPGILKEDLPFFNPQSIKLQNIWVQAQSQ